MASLELPVIGILGRWINAFSSIKQMQKKNIQEQEKKCCKIENVNSVAVCKDERKVRKEDHGHGIEDSCPMQEENEYISTYPIK